MEKNLRFLVRDNEVPERIVVQGFRAGWAAACEVIASSLEDIAPPHVVRAIREAAAHSPSIVIEHSTTGGDS